MIQSLFTEYYSAAKNMGGKSPMVLEDYLTRREFIRRGVVFAAFLTPFLTSYGYSQRPSEQHGGYDFAPLSRGSLLWWDGNSFRHSLFPLQMGFLHVYGTTEYLRASLTITTRTGEQVTPRMGGLAYTLSANDPSHLHLLTPYGERGHGIEYTLSPYDSPDSPSSHSLQTQLILKLPESRIYEESIFLQDRLILSYAGRTIPIMVSIMTFPYLLSDSEMPPLVTYQVENGLLTLTQYTHMTYAYMRCWDAYDTPPCRPDAFAPHLAVWHTDRWIPVRAQHSYATLPRLILEGERAWSHDLSALLGDMAILHPSEVIPGTIIVGKTRLPLPDELFMIRLPIMESTSLKRLSGGAYAVSWMGMPSFFEQHQQGILPRPCAETRVLTRAYVFGRGLNPLPGLAEKRHFYRRPRDVRLTYEACLLPEKIVHLT